MSIKPRFTTALASGIVLAKVGHPQREEELLTSKEVFRVAEDDQVQLTTLLLRPFKNLIPHRFTHHSSLDKNEMNACAKAIFGSHHQLLPRGIDIAKRLYQKSVHPNIKSGDLCIALINDIEMGDERVQGLCILKSETVVPFLSISTEDGDLRLCTEQGINPEKIDKGCLIINHWAQKGYYVLTFDRTGADTKFWVREFLGLQAVPDSDFLTNKYADMAVEFLKQEMPAEEASPEQRCTAAQEALAWFDDREQFNLQEFEQDVLKTREAAEKFAEHRSRAEEEFGTPLETAFEIAPKQLNKVKRRVNAVLKLDTGVEIHLKPTFVGDNEHVLERGYDDERGMKFIKVFYHNDVSAQQ